MVRVLRLAMAPPPRLPAKFPENVELETVRVPLLKMPPPVLVAELLERVELEILRVPKFMKPPPWFPAVLPEMMEFEMEKVLFLRLYIPPPLLLVETLPEIVEVVTETVP